MRASPTLPYFEFAGLVERRIHTICCAITICVQYSALQSGSFAKGSLYLRWLYLRCILVLAKYVLNYSNNHGYEIRGSLPKLEMN